LFERWQKTALLVFSALALVWAKTKCAVCAAGFSLLTAKAKKRCRPRRGGYVFLGFVSKLLV